MYGCMIGAKAQPTARRALHRDGHAEGVVYMDENGTEVTQPASTVMASALTPATVSATSCVKVRCDDREHEQVNRVLLLLKIGGPYDPATFKGTLCRYFTKR